MPRFFDDYSNTYLTHDSAAGRKQQRRGWKFRENFKLHYEKYLDEWRSGPMGLAAAQQAFAKNSGSSFLPPLPDGWIEEDDEVTRAKFYTHKETGIRQWLRPGFVPPPANMMNRPPNVMMQPPGKQPSSMLPPPGNFLPPPPMPMMMQGSGGQLPPPPMGLPFPPPPYFPPPAPHLG